MTLQTCPCRKTAAAPLSFAECCQPVLERRAKAASAEALMRARYSAFAVGDINFLVESVAPEAREGMERGSLEAWSRESEWLGLDILDTVAGQPGDATGVVEFIAHYSRGGSREAHHERSTFRHGAPGDCWYFVDGEKPRGKTVVKGAQPGRNDPCSCGSGKKYKKCCGAAA